MFPEFKCLSSHPWNKADLTPRQHYIAHLIIWKAFPEITSPSQALHYMSHGKWKEQVKYSVIYEKLMIIWRENQSEVSKRSNKERLENGTHHLKKVPCVDVEGNVIMIEKEEFYERKSSGCTEFVALSSKEGRFRKRGEKDRYRNSKGTIACIEKDGTFSRIPKEEYFRQNGHKEQWKYVHISSNEGIKRKNNGTLSRGETSQFLSNRPEVMKIKRLQEELGVVFTSNNGWQQKSITDLKNIFESLRKIKKLIRQGVPLKTIENMNFYIKVRFSKREISF